jgi:hypothetical protein
MYSLNNFQTINKYNEFQFKRCFKCHINQIIQKKKKKCSHSILDLISIICDIIYYNTKCNISKARNYLMQ